METQREKAYRFRAWFAYRLLSRNVELKEKYGDFYVILDKFFLKKYHIGTEEQTRCGIDQLFCYESERYLPMNEEIVKELLEEYKKENSLLIN